MGDPVPPTWPVIEDGMFYRIMVDGYDNGFPPGDCDEPFIGSAICCQPSLVLNGWFALGGDCNQTQEICTLSGWSAQRAVSIKGPYDNIDDCLDW